MSCTDNESGPFVVFFLPAVVGCLTILLARRWATAQGSSSTSTAVSRRRKIIKDPLVKRPLPPLTCKMVAPGSKKASGVSKKGSLAPSEEDSNGSRRVKSTRTTSVATELRPLPEGPVPPKHVPFPYIPQDTELLCEVMSFIFIVAATGLQYVNLYKTAWWLPKSHVAETIHFYLIDPLVVVFILLLSGRRLLLSAVLSSARLILGETVAGHLAKPARLILGETVAGHLVKPARSLILGVIGGVLIWLTYVAASKYSLMKIFYLVYPLVVYLLLFGLDSRPAMELSNPENPIHCCLHDPELVRAEVEILRHDFNLRVKKILFNSVMGAYYSSFIPCCFAPPYLYYDVYRAAQQTALVWAGLFGRYCSLLLPAAYCDVPHRATLHLGRWRPDPVSIDSGVMVSSWSGAVAWHGGARVAARGALFSAEARTPTAPVHAVPGDPHHVRFYMVFINPSVLICVLLCLQLALVLIQLLLLFTATVLFDLFAIMILLFINYYSLFKITRDFIISAKVYRAESILQDKSQTSTYGQVH